MKYSQPANKLPDYTSDFNTYDSMVMAESALKRWLGRYNKDGTMNVKILKL